NALTALNLPLFDPAVPQATTVGASVPSRFNGGYFTALGNLFGQDFKTYQFGVRFSFPWRNRTAEGNLGRALATGRQIEAEAYAELIGLEVLTEQVAERR